MLAAAALGCSGPSAPYANTIPLGTACATIEGFEACVESPPPATVTRASGAVMVKFEAVARIAGASLGYEEALFSVEAELPADATFPHRLEAGAILAPTLLTCTRVIAHLDHCDFNIRDDLACEVPLDAGSARFAVTVDALSDDAVQLRFTGMTRLERPDCCVNTCARDNIPEPVADPGDKYRITGGLHVEVATTAEL